MHEDQGEGGLIGHHLEFVRHCSGFVQGSKPISLCLYFQRSKDDRFEKEIMKLTILSMRLIRGIGSLHLNLPLDFPMHSEALLSQEADLSARRFEVKFRRTKERKKEKVIATERKRDMEKCESIDDDERTIK